MSECGYDIIGDVHGCARTLARLLKKLGYEKKADVFTHSERKAVFVGDIVDRGPRIREALQIVKPMVDAGQAYCVMGNHEYNALGYVTPTVESEHSDDVRYVRAHNRRHNTLISETLSQFASYPEEWRMYLEWFRRLPVFLDFGHFRVVHACWDHALIGAFSECYPEPNWDTAFIQKSADRETLEGRTMDRLTRGTDLPLPEGRIITGRDGYDRRLFRTKFWSEHPDTYGDIAFQPDPLPEDIADIPLKLAQKRALIYYDETDPPVFVGHYWLQGKPARLRKNVACLDYSAVKFGRLAAYRFDGEVVLDNEKFVWEYVEVEDDH